MKKLSLLSLILIIAGFYTAILIKENRIPIDSSTSTATKYIALTFDDGPKAGYTDVLLKGLKERSAKATFFIIGLQIDEYSDIIKQMYQDSHQIASHTYDHKNLASLSTSEQKSQVARWEETMSRYISEDSFYIRPPYGNVSSAFKNWIEAPIILWSVDPRDWDHKTASEIANHCISEVQDGDILLMHDIYKNSVEAALMVIDVLTEQGYHFVTVEELFKIKDIELENGKVYRKAY